MLPYTRLERLATDKHSSLLDPVLAYEENEVLWIWSHEPTLDWSTWNVLHLGKIQPYPQILDYAAKPCQAQTF